MGTGVTLTPKPPETGCDELLAQIDSDLCSCQFHQETKPTLENFIASTNINEPKTSAD